MNKKIIEKIRTGISVDTQNNVTAIPKNIFQTYATTELSQGAFDAVNSWRKLNPTWTHYFFTDEDQRAYIAKHFSTEVLSAYDQLIPGAYKADLWRYCALYTQGGIYIDHKLKLNIALDDMMSTDVTFATYADRPMPRHKQQPYCFYLWQAVLLSTPKHPFLKQAINNIVANVKKGNYGHDTLSITGPGLLGQSVNEVLQRPFDTPFQLGKNSVNNFDFYIMPNPFQDKKKRLATPELFSHKSAMQTYPTYLQERNKKSIQSRNLKVVDYASAWFLNKVFKHGKCVRNNEGSYYSRRLRGFYRRKARLAYKFGDYTFAHDLVITTLKRNPFQPKVWLLWLKYEFLKNNHKKG